MIPFRRNSPVVENLTSWHTPTDDPVYRLVFSQRNMLPAADVARLADLLSASDSRPVPQNQRPCAAAGLADDDQLPAPPLITNWQLPDRALHAYVPPQPLAEEELIASWAGKQTTVGCVVATGPTSRRAAR